MDVLVCAGHAKSGPPGTHCFIDQSAHRRPGSELHDLVHLLKSVEGRLAHCPNAELFSCNWHGFLPNCIYAVSGSGGGELVKNS